MLIFRGPPSGETTSIAVADGGVIGVGMQVAAEAELLTCARVFVVGDLVRRVLEDIHPAQVLAVVITQDQSAVERFWRSGLMLRPAAGMFTTVAEAEASLGKPLGLVITTAGAEDTPTPPPPLVAVAPVRSLVPVPEPDTTVRFALTTVKYTYDLEMTSSLLERSNAVLNRWRDRMEQWSRHPSRPIPASFRAAVTAALDDDLNVAQVVTTLNELENAEDVEPGAKFEAFSYVDRVLAVDLARNLGRVRH